MNNSDMPAMPQSIMKPNSVYQQEYALKGSDASITIEYTGLTKREHFAAMAMQGVYAGGTNEATYDGIAEMAVKAADALLAALEAK
jgi:hypothetical protein